MARLFWGKRPHTGVARRRARPARAARRAEVECAAGLAARAPPEVLLTLKISAGGRGSENARWATPVAGGRERRDSLCRSTSLVERDDGKTVVCPPVFRLSMLHDQVLCRVYGGLDPVHQYAVYK